MDFFEQQKWAMRRTQCLIIAFVFAVFLMGVFFHTAIMTSRMAAAKLNGEFEGSIIAGVFTHPEAPSVLLGSLLGVWAIVGLGSLYRISQLWSGGGESIAELLGGTEISPYTQTFEERQLMNIVEEMAIASGVIVPIVYVLKKETRINAFSAGLHSDFAVIGVTAGALNYLNRDELQALIAHEFSHILNGDMRLNSIMMGLLFGLEMVTEIGLIIGLGVVHIRENDDGDDEYVFFGGGYFGFFLLFLRAPVGIFAVLIGAVGSLLGAFIKSAISRQREYLADAAAVQFTRNSEGLKNAMLKIGCKKIGSRILSAYAIESNHLFFASVLSNFQRFNPLASHPSLTARIKRLDSGFDEKFPEQVRKIRLFGAAAAAATTSPSAALMDEILQMTNPRLGRFIVRQKAAVKEGGIDLERLVASRRVDVNLPSREECKTTAKVMGGTTEAISNAVEIVPEFPDEQAKSDDPEHGLDSVFSGRRLLSEDAINFSFEKPASHSNGDAAAQSANRESANIRGNNADGEVVVQNFPSYSIDVSGPRNLADPGLAARSLVTGKSIDELLDELEADAAAEKNEEEQDGASAETPLPEAVQKSLKTASGAARVFLSLLLDSDVDSGDLLRERLYSQLGPEEMEALDVLLREIKSLRGTKKTHRLPDRYVDFRNRVLEQGIPVLRTLPPGEYRVFRKRIALLASLLKKVDLFRYTFYAIVRNELDAMFLMVDKPVVPAKYHGKTPISEQIRLALSFLAYAGHDDVSEAKAAFQAALAIFDMEESLFPVSNCTFRGLDDSLKKIRFASEPIRTKCLKAFRVCICTDGVITPREDEIYRAATAMIGG